MKLFRDEMRKLPTFPHFHLWTKGARSEWRLESLPSNRERIPQTDTIDKVPRRRLLMIDSWVIVMDSGAALVALQIQ